MLYGMDNKPEKELKEFHQRVADQNIQGLGDRQDEINQAKNSFLGMLGGIVVGGVVGWLFLGPADNANNPPVIPVIRRPITPAKVQPNDPGGMEIDNQDREIYHIVDNIPKKVKKVNIRPVPDMPKMVVENTISAAESMDELVESIDDNGGLNKTENTLKDTKDDVQVAHNELVGIETNSKNKIVIPQKIKNIEVKLQKNIKDKAIELSEPKTSEPIKKTATVKDKHVTGTWYAQIIASSSQKAVKTLWWKLSNKHKYLKNYPHEIEKITAANGNTLYRLKVGSFKTREEAVVLGEKLKNNQISSIIKKNR